MALFAIMAGTVRGFLKGQWKDAQWTKLWNRMKFCCENSDWFLWATSVSSIFDLVLRFLVNFSIIVSIDNHLMEWEKNCQWYFVISRYFLPCFSLFRKFASVRAKTLYFYLNEVAEESYPYRGNVRSKVSAWMFFSAFRTDFRNLPNKTSVFSWQQPATAAFKMPGNIPSTVKPGTPLLFVW